MARPQACSYQSLLPFTTRTTSSITGTSISTPTTVASAAPEEKPNRLIAAATAPRQPQDASLAGARGKDGHPVKFPGS